MVQRSVKRSAVRVRWEFSDNPKAFYKIPGWVSSSFLIPIPCKRRAYVGA